jgi:hypothetical protein
MTMPSDKKPEKVPAPPSDQDTIRGYLTSGRNQDLFSWWAKRAMADPADGDRLSSLVDQEVARVKFAASPSVQGHAVTLAGIEVSLNAPTTDSQWFGSLNIGLECDDMAPALFRAALGPVTALEAVWDTRLYRSWDMVCLTPVRMRQYALEFGAMVAWKGSLAVPTAPLTRGICMPQIVPAGTIPRGLMALALHHEQDWPEAEAMTRRFADEGMALDGSKAMQWRERVAAAIFSRLRCYPRMEWLKSVTLGERMGLLPDLVSTVSELKAPEGSLTAWLSLR